MPESSSHHDPSHNPIEQRLRNLAQILDQAVAAVNAALTDLRSDEEGPQPEEGRHLDDL